MSIAEIYRKIREEVPRSVAVVVAAKGRTKEELEEVIDAGATDLGENYVQEAEKVHEALGDKAKKVKWHMLGHLQKNKINKALGMFDVIQTIDSEKIAVGLSKRAEAIGKMVPVYIEINIGGEETKSGVKAEFAAVENLALEISRLEHLRLEGIMTIEPPADDPEISRPHFKKAKEIFDKLRALNLPNVVLKTLSMGMSGSYKAAIEEGSNMVRIGTAIFGER